MGAEKTMKVSLVAGLVAFFATGSALAIGLEQQRLSRMPFGQDAEQDQRIREGDFTLRGRGQAGRFRPRHQHLRWLPFRHHGKPSRRQCGREIGELRPVS